MCAQLCQHSSPTAREWYSVATHIQKSDREVMNFFSRQMIREMTPKEPSSAARKEHEGDEATTATGLSGLAWTLSEDDADYFGNDPTKVFCPVPIDLQMCRIPRRPETKEGVDGCFTPCPIKDSKMFYEDLDHALYVDQVCIHPVTHQHVFPMWAAYLPRMFNSYDQLIALTLKRKEDVVLCQCVARDLVFALVRNRQFAPGTAMVMYLIVGLCYYIAAIRTRLHDQAASAVAAIPAVDTCKTPVSEPASITLPKARTPPVSSTKQRTSDAITRGAITFVTVFKRESCVGWNIPMEWCNAILPFEQYRFTAVQHAYASASHWFHYTEIYAALNAYFEFSVNESWSLKHYRVWFATFVQSYKDRDATFKHHSRTDVERVARSSIDTTFKAWYMRLNMPEAIKTHEDPHGPLSLVTGTLKTFNDLLPQTTILSPSQTEQSRITKITMTTTTTTTTKTTETKESEEKGGGQKRRRSRRYIVGNDGRLHPLTEDKNGEAEDESVPIPRPRKRRATKS